MFSCYMIVTHIRHSSYRNRTIIRHRSFIWFCESPEVFKRCLNNSYIIRLNSFSNFVDMKIYIKLNERKKCIMQRMYNFIIIFKRALEGLKRNVMRETAFINGIVVTTRWEKFPFALMLTVDVFSTYCKGYCVVLKNYTRFHLTPYR